MGRESEKMGEHFSLIKFHVSRHLDHLKKKTNFNEKINYFPNRGTTVHPVLTPRQGIYEHERHDPGHRA
jgi:hypothetical protein